MAAASNQLEPAMKIDRSTLSPQKEVVRKFYKDLWDHADVTLIPEIFHADFTFRGSLGPVLIGHAQFADYVRWVTSSIENYTSDILGMAEEGDQVFAKLRFHGLHRKQFFGQPATGRHVWWYGAPIFTFDGDKVRDLWVLGDIHGLIGRMKDGDAEEAEFSMTN
ncbi:MAG: ester cyclase [Pusillimonas sp.]